MFTTRFALFSAAALALTISTSAIASAQDADRAPRTITIKLIDQAGPKPYAFEPGIVSARRGDTLKFVQAAATMHNVHFIATPNGAKLGSAATSEYLTTKGQTYTVVVDSRFTDGKYEIVCDPHEAIGMHAFVTVSGGK